MITSALTLFAVVMWTGTAQVDVMIWQPGGEHPYTTAFELAYREAERVPILDPKGRLAGYGVRLIPERIAISVHHEVRHADGRLICRGGGGEVVPGGPEGRIVLPAPGTQAYQLVLPRAVGAFACGTRRNERDRWVVIGTGLLHPAGEIDAADPATRTLDSPGLRMQGTYESSDASRGGPVRHDYRVRWELHKHVRE